MNTSHVSNAHEMHEVHEVYPEMQVPKNVSSIKGQQDLSDTSIVYYSDSDNEDHLAKSEPVGEMDITDAMNTTDTINHVTMNSYDDSGGLYHDLLPHTLHENTFHENSIPTPEYTIKRPNDEYNNINEPPLYNPYALVNVATTNTATTADTATTTTATTHLHNYSNDNKYR